jgi:hypothetical protein
MVRRLTPTTSQAFMIESVCLSISTVVPPSLCVSEQRLRHCRAGSRSRHFLGSRTLIFTFNFELSPFHVKVLTLAGFANG